jgi:TetR/AcrR family transcriptional regulator, cholesterol catabolism regulator
VIAPKGAAAAKGAPAKEAETPLAAVTAVLRRAGEDGTLSGAEVEWSISRLVDRSRRGNPHLEGVDRREALLRAAAVVFRRSGYGGATIEEIAGELMLSKAAVYHYFSSKREILEALCVQVNGEVEAAVAAAHKAEAADPAARLEAMLDAYAATVLAEPAFAVLMRHINELSEPVLDDVQRRRKRIESSFQKTLRAGVEAGVLRAGDIEVAVFGMLGAINWIYAWYERDGRLEPERVREHLIALVMDGVRDPAA